jgi:hypothetical protein
MFVITEAIRQAGSLGELDTTKASKILKANLKVMRVMPKFLKISTKEQIMADLGAAVGKEYTNALPKELGVEDLLNIQKDKWAGRGGGDMMQLYSSVGITEQEVKDAIEESISYWKDKAKQPADKVAENL